MNVRSWFRYLLVQKLLFKHTIEFLFLFVLQLLDLDRLVSRGLFTLDLMKSFLNLSFLHFLFKGI
jgi:hypothetical protein